MSPIERLSVLGLTRHEAAVYCALVGVEQASAAELAGPAGVDRTHVYAALKRLQARGLVTSSCGRVKRYSAVEPGSALRVCLAGKERELAAGRKAVSELSRAFRKRRPARDELPAVEAMANTAVGAFAEVRARLRGARREVLSVVGRQALPSQKEKSLKADRLQRTALRRGVPSRCVYGRGLLKHEFERERLRVSVRAGEQARVVNGQPLNMLVVDDDLAVLALPGEGDDYTVYRFNDPGLVGIFRLAFEQLWSRARAVDDYLKDGKCAT